MISITCTQCQTVLTIDDAFAGGVCRCQHCGTIQTVPSRPKATATPQPFVGPSSGKSKALYQNEAARTNSGNLAASTSTSPSGLDELANAVATSSGLSGSGLQSPKLKTAAPAVARQAPPARTATTDYATAEPEATEPRKTPIVPIAIGGGILLLALVGVIVYLLFFRGASTGGPGGGGGGTGTGGTGTASFCGEPIAGNKVIYLLDDANSIANDFDPLKAATYTSIASLGADHKFAVILWDNGEEFTFPRDGMATATPDQIDALRAKFQDTQATGASHIRAALDRAMSRSPSTIVIVTAKSFDDPDDQAAIGAAKDAAGGKIKFYSVTVGIPSENQFLKMTAESTGAKYKNMSSQDLRAVTP